MHGRAKKLASDDGMVLVIVMIAIMLITILAVGGYSLASQSMHETARLETESRAFQVASSGMDRELSSFSETNFQGGATTYTSSGTTPDGSYTVSVGQSTVPFMYTMVVNGTRGNEVATLKQNFFYMDLWAVNIAAGSNPSAGPFGSAGSWNGNSTIIGPLLCSGDVDFNSNVQLYGGPLFASGGSVNFRGGVDTHPPSGGTYNIFASGGVTGEDADAKVYNSCPRIDLPWLDPDYISGMEAVAAGQSTDGMRGTTSNSNAAEVIAKTRAAGATADYKVINGPLVITGATPSFGISGADRDDFAFDTATDTLYVEGAVFVNGDILIGSGVREYAGNGTIVASAAGAMDGDIVIATGGRLEPITDDGDDVADDLTIENCLAVVAEGDVTIDSCMFEGVVFTNGGFNINRTGGFVTEFEGPVHAHAINSNDTHNILEMETDFSASYLPGGVPGSATDPRGPDFGGNGMVVPGTWSRQQ